MPGPCVDSWPCGSVVRKIDRVDPFSPFNHGLLGDAARLAQRWIAERGWTYHQHIHSPEEIDAHLDVWEELSEEFDIAAMRWTPGHLSNITPELVDRAVDMGLGLGAHGQPYHSGSVAGGPPWRTILNSGAVAVGAGSDGARINVLNPWCIIYYMATGMNVNGELTNADETVSRYEAVRYYSSVEQGWFTKEDDTLGGIDSVVLPTSRC